MKLDPLDPWVLLGRYFGYPECCITEFCNIPAFMDDKNRDIRIEKAGDTGFVPCGKCAKSDTELKDLIKDRKCPTEFPIGGSENEKQVAELVYTLTKEATL